MTVQRKCKNGREYRYYRCNEDNRRAEKTCREQRFPADELESLVLSQILKVLKTPTMLGRLDGRLDAEGLPIAQKISEKLAETWEVMYPGERNMLVHDILSKVVVYPDRIRIEFNMSGIEELLVDAGLEKVKGGEHAPYSYEVPCDLCKYGNVTKLAAPTVGEIQRNEVLVKAISTAYQYAEKLEHGKYQGSVIDLAFDLGKDKSDVRRTLKLVNLAPDIVQSIFNGDGPKKLSLADLMRAMPADWSEQRRMLGFPEAVG